MIENILVAGATGRTGRIIVQKLIQQGFRPHVLVRNPEAVKTLLGEGVIYHQGDVREPKTLPEAMLGIEGVISAIGSQTPVGKNCPKRVDYQGVANLVEAARLAKVKRFILISSIAVTHPEHPLNCFGKVLDWKRKGEDILRDSSMEYAIIRPGGLKDTPGGVRMLIFDQGDKTLGTISREDVAEVCLDALQYPHRLQVTFEITEQDQNREPATWMPLLASLSQD